MRKSKRQLPIFVDDVLREHGWRKTNAGFEKDGYEIYFMPYGGFEFTVRSPDGSEREAIVKRSNLSHKHPLTIAIVEHLLKNAENVAASYREQQ